MSRKWRSYRRIFGWGVGFRYRGRAPRLRCRCVPRVRWLWSTIGRKSASGRCLGKCWKRGGKHLFDRSPRLRDVLIRRLTSRRSSLLRHPPLESHTRCPWKSLHYSTVHIVPRKTHSHIRICNPQLLNRHFRTGSCTCLKNIQLGLNKVAFRFNAFYIAGMHFLAYGKFPS